MASTAAAAPTTGVEDTRKSRTTSTKLEDHAALAALYVTKYDNSSKNGQAFLDSDHRLSSASAATSLKYANPQDLPSYPISGLKKKESAAGAAASLGWANQKPFEHWKPDPSASASAAAMMAKDYKMKELWQPEQSAHGAKAAVLAHRDGRKVEIWRPETDPAWGNSAATQAFKKFSAGGLSPALDYGYTALGRQGSLLAATGAMSQSRKRALSSPSPTSKTQTYSDEMNANALSAATLAHRTQKRSDMFPETGAIPLTTMSRASYTSHPPVALEIEERNHADTLRASAIAMAKQMYNVQQKQFDQASHAQHGASAAHHRKSSSSAISDEVQPMRFNNLQEAAQKLAQQRLSKLHDEHAQNREYRDYYGNNSKPFSRLSIRGRTRRRASSDGGMDDDKAQSNKIRDQMSLFSSNLSQVDAKKRASDREALIAAAQRNVTKSLHGMDERVFADTGKVSPSLLSEWEVKAHAAAQAKSNTRMENYGKIHIGGGKFVDQSEVDAVARGNVQPVLDEINEKAAAEQERQAAIKADQEETARKGAERKQREKEKKAIDRKLKQQDKEEEKLRVKEEKEEARATQRSGKEKRKSGTAGVVPELSASPKSPDEPVTVATGGTAVTSAETEIAPPTTHREAPTPIRTSMEDQASLRMQTNADAATVGESTPISPNASSPDSGKGKSRMSWLKTKFSRRLSRSQKIGGSEEKDAAKEETGFVGGAALTGVSANNSTASLGAGSRDAVALAKPKDLESVPAATPVGETSATLDPATEAAEPAFLHLNHETQEPTIRKDENEQERNEQERIEHSTHRFSEISALSADLDEKETKGKDILEEGPPKNNEDEEFQEARDNFDQDLAPPPTFPAEKSSSPAREAKFTEVMD